MMTVARTTLCREFESEDRIRRIQLNKKLVLTLALIPLLVPHTFAQKRSRTTQPQKRGSVTRQRAVTPPAPPVFREEAAALAEQLKVVTRFLYLYGRVANGLETADAQEKRGELSRTLIEQNKQNKTRVVENIRTLRAGLDGLLTRFQNNSKLQPQAFKILSATEDAANAEQLAANGRFDEAGRLLVKVAEKLAEVTVETR
jgi:hypothetical protein